MSTPSHPVTDHPLHDSYSEFYHLLEMNLEVGARNHFAILETRYLKMQALHAGFCVEGLDELIKLYKLGLFDETYQHLREQMIKLARAYLAKAAMQNPGLC